MTTPESVAETLGTLDGVPEELVPVDDDEPTADVDPVFADVDVELDGVVGEADDEEDDEEVLEFELELELELKDDPGVSLAYESMFLATAARAMRAVEGLHRLSGRVPHVYPLRSVLPIVEKYEDSLAALCL